MLEGRLTREPPWAVLAPGTAWGREVAARLATRMGAGLTGDAIGLEVRDGRLVAFKPAFGGRMVAQITCTSGRPDGDGPPGDPPRDSAPDRTGPSPSNTWRRSPGSRTRIIERHRNDDRDQLANADVVIGVGVGVDPTDLPEIEAHAAALIGAELCATRQGHRRRLDAPCPAGGDNRPLHRATALPGHRNLREVQPHGGHPLGGNGRGNQSRPGLRAVVGLRRRNGRRLALSLRPPDTQAG